MQIVWASVSSLWLSLFACSGTAADWQPQSKTDDVVQYWIQTNTTRPYQTTRAEITINAPMGPLLVLLQDAQVQHKWFPFTHQVTVIDRPAPGQTVVHFQAETLWPFEPRDAITLFEVQQTDPDTLRIGMHNQPKALPELNGYLRIQTADSYWLLKAQPNCQTQVRYESGSRWDGTIPQWLVDRSNARIAVQALQNLKPFAEQHYRDYATYDSMPPSTLHEDCR